MMHNKSVIFIDLDGTLIQTRSGSAFPIDEADFVMRYEVIEKLHELDPHVIAIVTNQAGISHGFVNEETFKLKLELIRRTVNHYVPDAFVMSLYAPTQGTPDHKPNIGMFKTAMGVLTKEVRPYLLSECLMVGDASGLAGDYSDIDKQFAANCHIDYCDVETFIGKPRA